MKCVSCQGDINPKWKHALSQNICPLCGEHIMEEHLKNCLAALSTAMQNMLQYQDQLSDWLLSNHNYIKTDSPNLLSYLPEEILQTLSQKSNNVKHSLEDPETSVIKVKVPDGNGGVTIQEVFVEKTQSKEATNGFFERAEVVKGMGKTSGKMPKSVNEPEPPKSVSERTAHLKKIAQQIKQGTYQESEVIQETDMADIMAADGNSNGEADPEMVAQLRAAIGGDLVSSGLPVATNGDFDEESALTDRVLANNLRISKKDTQSSLEKDKITLQEMQNKVNNTQRKMGNGGFTRSS